MMKKYKQVLTDEETRAWDESLLSCEQRSVAAQAKAAQAYARLLHLAETRDSGQIRKIAQFIAATYNGATFTFDLFELRSLDVEISDDMLAALDALRWGKADLFQLVPDGDRRVQSVIALWGLNQTI